jgi:tRNA threonylcarbamoyladenosine biosynthesis protein TsaB
VVQVIVMIPVVSDGTGVIILGIDTAGPAGSVALVDGTQVLASFYLRRPPAFSPHLLRLIDLVFDQAGYCLADLAGLAVNLGPGAFTGLRVGLATMQGLAMASGKPLVGCSAFEALLAFVGGWDGMVCPVLEARRGEVYAAFYRRQGVVVHETMPGMVVTPEALCALVTERTLFLGSGVQAYGAVFAARLGARAVCVDTGVEVGLAVSVARLGVARLGAPTPTPPPLLTPLYIRAADAQVPRHLAAATGQSAVPLTPASGGVECASFIQDRRGM